TLAFRCWRTRKCTSTSAAAKLSTANSPTRISRRCCAAGSTSSATGSRALSSPCCNSRDELMLTIVRTTEAMPKQSGSPTHQNRLVVAPTDYANQSPFLLMAEDWFAPPSGFPTHPHRGMETVTFVLEGALEHRDHTGAHGVLGAGDVQFMTAGGGV